MKRRLLYSTITMAGLLSFYGCKNKQEDQPITIDSQTTEEVIDTNEEITFNNLGEDEDGFEHYSILSGFENMKEYPKHYDFKTKMITPGTFHSDEVPTEVNDIKWYGLYKDTDQAYKITEAKPEVSQVFDPVLDEDGEMTGVEVAQSEEKPFLAFVESNIDLTTSAIETTTLPSYIYPGEKVQFTYKGKEYTLFATGTRKSSGISEQDIQESIVNGFEMPKFYVKDYTLRLEVKDTEMKNEIVLLSQKFFEEGVVPKIMFGGDINNDNVVDLILDTATHYNVSRPTLYLSKQNQNQVTLKPVAAHETVGC
ncbi:hypothetical protein [Myroides phaeus]|uniref:Uncharacterized protein n=1 Tax=Myroides phaeus TaxID=702745 RepID=A0A1G8EHD3_9FLAO|nr:hypothetical protein [Myroides phaeus]SDH69323.1 hypothetical protein SAMN05421818_1113 [Myroides phaeus]